MVRRKGLVSQDELEQFLCIGGHVEPNSLSADLFPTQTPDSTLPEEPVNDKTEDRAEPTKTDLIRSLSKKQLVLLLVLFLGIITIAITYLTLFSPKNTVVTYCPDDSSMVFVEAGPFLYGSTAEEIAMFAENCPPDDLDCGTGYFVDELPKQRLWLPAYCIDQYEVTNSDFKRFVDTTRYTTTAEKRGTSDTWND